MTRQRYPWMFFRFFRVGESRIVADQTGKPVRAGAHPGARSWSR